MLKVDVCTYQNIKNPIRIATNWCSCGDILETDKKDHIIMFLSHDPFNPLRADGHAGFTYFDMTHGDVRHMMGSLAFRLIGHGAVIDEGDSTRRHMLALYQMAGLPMPILKYRDPEWTPPMRDSELRVAG